MVKSPEPDFVPTHVDTAVPSVARAYDFLLGGSHNFAPDRKLAQQVEKAYPGARILAQMNRAYLARVAMFMVGRGVRQFLDIGSGIPTVGNVHEVVERAVDASCGGAGRTTGGLRLTTDRGAPTCRTMYVDKDLIAVAHSELLLEDMPFAGIVQADMREPEAILEKARGFLDLDKPVGLIFASMLHWLSDKDDPWGLVNRYMQPLAMGSYLAISHLTGDTRSRQVAAMVDVVAQSDSADSLNYRSAADITRLFAGLELVEPGIVGCGLWRPDNPADTTDDDELNQQLLVGLGRKP
jgi:hypothetical protein